MAYACRYLKGQGAKALIGEYLPTQRNGLAANVYRDLGFHEIEWDQDGTRWQLSLDENDLVIPDWFAVESAKEITYALTLAWLRRCRTSLAFRVRKSRLTQVVTLLPIGTR